MAVERARDEVNTLAARRDDITRQLGRLSGVIEALAVPERPPLEETYGGPPDEAGTPSDAAPPTDAPGDTTPSTTHSADQET